MPADPTFVAFSVAVISLAFASGTAIGMLVLMLRRRRQERAALSWEETKNAASRQLMRALAGAEHTDNIELPAEAWLAALSHLLRLIRGGDRDRLLALAERRGIFSDAIRNLHHPRPARRIDAMRVIEQFGSEACLSALRGLLMTDPVAAVRLEAAAALAPLGALPPVIELVAALGLDDQPATRLHAALFRSLAKRDAAQLAELASSRRYHTLRPLLVEALGWTGQAEMLQVLAGHSRDADPEVRCSAVRAARHLGLSGDADWICAMLSDPSEAVRIQAAQACGQLHLTGAVPSLERLATEPSWWVRIRARAALDVLRPGSGPILLVARA